MKAQALDSWQTAIKNAEVTSLSSFRQAIQSRVPLSASAIWLQFGSSQAQKHIFVCCRSQELCFSPPAEQILPEACSVACNIRLPATGFQSSVCIPQAAFPLVRPHPFLRRRADYSIRPCVPQTRRSLSCLHLKMILSYSDPVALIHKAISARLGGGRLDYLLSNAAAAS